MSADQPQWIEVRVVCPAEWSELVADVLARETRGSVAFGSSSRVGERTPSDCEQVRGFYDADRDAAQLRASIVEQLHALAQATEDRRLAQLEVLFKPLAPEDWANSWRKSWRPLRVGRICLLTYDWQGQLRQSDVELRFEPGGSFGTGRHATTRECLRFLGEQDLAGARVLDAGSGSGLLSVAALLLGADSVFGFDIDERSPKEGLALARRNGVAQGASFAHGGFELLEQHAGPYTHVLANIYADMISDHAASLKGVMERGGKLVFSGIREDHLDQALDSVLACGLRVHEIRARGRWRTLLGER